MDDLESLREEIAKVQTRNKRVELDKAWETSWTRRVLVLSLTYSVVVIFFFTANLPEPFINAIVPSLAFVISTFTMPFFKKWWLGNKK